MDKHIKVLMALVIYDILMDEVTESTVELAHTLDGLMGESFEDHDYLLVLTGANLENLKGVRALALEELLREVNDGSHIPAK